MKFFSNSAINRVYFHSGLQSLAYNSGGVFIYVYLLKAGLPTPLVFVTMAAVIMSRLFLRLMVLPIVQRLGLRNGLMLGSAIDGSSYLLLGHVQGVDGNLAAYAALASLGTTFYWTCYHACVARLGDEESRGSQVSVREAIFALTGIIGPLCGGLALTLFGPVMAFAVTTLISLLAIVPLFGIGRLNIEPEATLTRATKLFAGGLAFSDGLVASSVNFGWRVALFKTLGENFDAYGGALAIAGLFGAGMGLVVGRMIDMGHHHRSVHLALAAMSATIMTEALGHGATWTAVAANMLGAVAGPLYMSAIMAPFYNEGKNSGCSLRFNITGENGFDTGAGFGCLIAALAYAAGLDSFWPLLFGLTGCVGVFVILRRHHNQ